MPTKPTMTSWDRIEYDIETKTIIKEAQKRYWRNAMWKTRRALLAILAVSAIARAQVREKRVVPLDGAQRQGFETRRRAGVAILVGVGKYPRYSQLSELRYSSRDVELLEKELAAQRYLVVQLKDGEATRAAVRNAIHQAGEVLDPAQGVRLFFFSGHRFAEDGTNYLATFDASGNALAQSGLPIQAVEKAMADAGATRRILLVDACRNEPGKGAGGGRSFTRFAGSAGTRILYSTKAGKIS
jgi:Caspase domain